MVESHRKQLAALTDEIVACRMCTRLVAWREKIGNEKRASYKDWDYWAKPVPSFGDPDASLVLLGLAPAAHGGNRTGRVFTGDPSASFLTAAMHKAGLANQPNSDHREDGLTLTGAYVCAAVRCVPPGDRPTPEEQRACLPYLVRELRMLPNLKVILALGHIAFRAALQTLSEMASERVRGKFLHGEVYRFGPSLPMMVASYHPSPRNTNTGVLSMEALVKVLNQAKELSLS
ncbi:MAG: uracil-DNA glycosylase [Chloroflexi bacterium]|nr:uracil-DNA glycosylase [Chloroflexota bacterium]MCI0847551.1 uracil-DNA glycosylase [Chloroflexota bacterium]MCI0863189.1 uracil-DNA glycosylase [Chloroflexota bacterium]